MIDLPHNLIAERGLLGIVLNSNDAIFEIGNLTAEDFSESYNGELFRLLKDQIEAGRAVSAAVLLHDAQDAVIWGDLKASEYLAKLEGEAPPARLAPEFALTIADAALKSKVIRTAEEIARRARAAPVSLSGMELRNELDEAMSVLFASDADVGVVKVGETGDTILDRLKNTELPPVGVSAGPVAIRDLIGDLLPGKVYFLAGSPGSGKSSLAVQMARDVSRNGRIAMIFSPEMSAEEITRRTLAADTGISDDQIERGLISTSEYEKLWHANEAIKVERVFVDAGSSPTMAAIRGRALRKKRTGGLDVLFIDHVGLISKPDRRMGEPDAWAENLKMCKQISKDLEIAVVPLVQFGTQPLRDMAQWPHRRPTQGDIAFSGYVDQNADVILLLHRAEYFLLRNKPSPEDLYKGKPYLDEWSARCLQMEGKVEAILAKRRSGGRGTGMRTFYFDAPRYTFADNAPRARVEDRDLLTVFP